LSNHLDAPFIRGGLVKEYRMCPHILAIRLWWCFQKDACA